MGAQAIFGSSLIERKLDFPFAALKGTGGELSVATKTAIVGFAEDESSRVRGGVFRFRVWRKMLRIEKAGLFFARLDAGVRSGSRDKDGQARVAAPNFHEKFLNGFLLPVSSISPRAGNISDRKAHERSGGGVGNNFGEIIAAERVCGCGAIPHWLARTESEDASAVRDYKNWRRCSNGSRELIFRGAR